MNIGDKVKVSGTNLEGVIVEMNPRRLPDRKAVISFYTVKFADGTTGEYGREEIRKI